MKHLNYLLVFLLLFFLSSCDTGNQNEAPPKDSIPTISKDTTGPNNNKENINIPKEEEDVKLGLTQAEEKKIMPQLGLTYKELQQNLPEIQALKIEDKEKSSKGLTETTARIVMLNKTIDAQFHFKNDSLVKCLYLVNELDYNQADKFYKGLQNFYSSKLGECKEAEVEEENHYNRSCNWVKDGYKAELNYDINKSIITWGIQK
jgi:hypothetical protein